MIDAATQEIDPNGNFTVIGRKVYLLVCKFTGETIHAYGHKRIAQIRCRDHNEMEGSQRFKVVTHIMSKKAARPVILF